MKATPENPAEKIVWTTLIWTWGFYAFGSLYVVGPVLAWCLGALAFLSLFLGPAIRSDLRATGPVPWLIWLWFAGMAVMLFALWTGHIDWGLGLKKTIKSSVGWAKGWALLALFPLAGAVLPIRREVLIRAQCILGLTTLIIAPLLLVAPFIGLPERIFTSPLRAVGGPGPEYFSVYLYTLDPASWTARWQFYAPWSPFAAILGILTVLFALEERHRGWMIAGLGAGVLMILASKSRMGLVGLVACTMGPRLLPLIARTWAWMMVSGLMASLAIWGSFAIDAGRAGIQGFRSARADSTRVRETLQRIAWERWQNDAVWFGHGTVQPGPHLVEYMPIGSHHTWYALLFVKGVVGFFAFFIPFVVHFLMVAVDTVRSSQGRLPLGILMTFLLLSFGENIEIEAYLMWPALVLLGCHIREMENRRDAGQAGAASRPVPDQPSILRRT